MPSSFSLATILPPEPEASRFPLGREQRPPLGWYRLGREIKRYLIIVYPRTFALDQRDAARRPPTLLRVLAGSSYFTRPRRIPPAPRRPVPRPGRPGLSSCAGLCSGTCRERSDFLTVTRGATDGYERFNCNNVREGCQ